MKKFLATAPFLLIIMIMQKHTDSKTARLFANEDMWSGNIIYRQITYDTTSGTFACGWQADTNWGEWRMEANIIYT